MSSPSCVLFPPPPPRKVILACCEQLGYYYSAQTFFPSSVNSPGMTEVSSMPRIVDRLRNGGNDDDEGESTMALFIQAPLLRRGRRRSDDNGEFTLQQQPAVLDLEEDHTIVIDLTEERYNITRTPEKWRKERQKSDSPSETAVESAAEEEEEENGRSTVINGEEEDDESSSPSNETRNDSDETDEEDDDDENNESSNGKNMTKSLPSEGFVRSNVREVNTGLRRPRQLNLLNSHKTASLNNSRRSSSLKRDPPLRLFDPTYTSPLLPLPSQLNNAAATARILMQSGYSGRTARKSQSSDFLDRIDLSLGNSLSEQHGYRRSKSSKLLPQTAKMSKIEDGLYLGNMEAATDVILLGAHAITHILTLDSVPLPRKISSALPRISNLFLQVTDLPDEDILSVVGRSVAFIEEGLKTPGGGNVLVHCFRGKSRSASVVVAYLMQKYSISMERALKRVMAKRDCVSPHSGFLAQLKLYESMEYHLDPTNVQFKMFRLQLASERMRKARILYQVEDLADEDPAELGSAKTGGHSQVFKCKRCRRTLATSHNLLPHVKGERPHWTDPKWSLPADEVLEGASDLGLDLCSSSVFVSPVRWMVAEVRQSLAGRLYCPNCQGRVGDYSWVAGCKCGSCGVVVVPAFQLDVTEIIFRTRNRFLQTSGREPVLV